MSTEGSVSIGINITEDFASVESKAKSLTAEIGALDSAIGTNKSRSISIKALLDSTKFDEALKAKVEQEHVIKIKVDPELLSKSIAAAFTADQTPHVIKTTVDLANVNSIIKSSFDAEHPINVTVNSTGLETKVQAAVKNKSYPVKIDFTADSAVSTALSSITASMENIAKLTAQVNKLTKTALGDLNAQMTTYFNDLNHIIDATNKVAETVEKSSAKKAESAAKAAEKVIADSKKAADAEIADAQRTEAQILASKDKAFALGKKLREEEAKSLEAKRKQEDSAWADYEANYTKHVQAVNKILSTEDANRLKLKEATAKQEKELLESELKDWEKALKERNALEESYEKALQKVHDDFHKYKIDKLHNFIKESGDLLSANNKKNIELIDSEIEKTRVLIQVQTDLLEAKKRAANLGAGTFENTGRTGSKTQGTDVGFPISMGGTGKSKQQTQQDYAELEQLQKDHITRLEQADKEYYEFSRTAMANSAAITRAQKEQEYKDLFKYTPAENRDYLRQVKETSLAMEAADKEKQIAAERKYTSEYEQAYQIHYEMEKKLHNDINAAYEQNTARDRRLFLDREAAYAENIERQKKYTSDYEQAYKMKYDMERKYTLDMMAAYEENTARQRKMFLDREAADKENYDREKRNHLMLKEAYEMNENMDKKARMERGAQLSSGGAIAIRPSDIQALREYRAEQEKLHGSTQAISQVMYRFNNVMMQLGIYMSVRQLTEYADHWMHFTSTVRVAMHQMIDSMERITNTTELLTKEQQKLLVEQKVDEVFKISQDTRTSIEDTATLFGRMSRAVESMGMGNDKAMLLTKELGQALMISGLNTQTARGALLQLEQALGGVVVRGQEFKSVNDGIPIIMQTGIKHYNEAKAAIEAMNAGYERGTAKFNEYVAAHKGSVMSLMEGRQLMLQGRMYSAVLAEAILEARDELDALSKDVEVTFGQSFNMLGNAFTKYIGQLNESSGASKEFNSFIKDITENFNTYASVAISVVSGIAVLTTGMYLAAAATNVWNAALTRNPLLLLGAALVTVGTALYTFKNANVDAATGANLAWDAFWKTFDESDNPMIKMFKAIKVNFDTFIADIKWASDMWDKMNNSSQSMTPRVQTAAEQVASGGSNTTSTTANPNSFMGQYDKNIAEAQKQAELEKLKQQLKAYDVQEKINNIQGDVEKQLAAHRALLNEQVALEAENLALAKTKHSLELKSSSEKDAYIGRAVDNFMNTFMQTIKKNGGNSSVTLEELMGIIDRKELTSSGLKGSAQYEQAKALSEGINKAKMEADASWAQKQIQDAADKVRKEQEAFVGTLPKLQEDNLQFIQSQSELQNSMYKKMRVGFKTALVESYGEATKEIENTVIKPRVATTTNEVLGFIDKYAAANSKPNQQIDPNMVKAIIQRESSWKPNLVNPESDATGLMQVMPANFKHYGVTNPNNSEQIISAGVKILSEDLKQFPGDIRLALAAYNWGGDNVKEKAGGDFDRVPQKVKNYVQDVLKYYQEFVAGKQGKLAPETIDSIKSMAGEYKKVTKEALVPDFSGTSEEMAKLLTEQYRLLQDMSARATTVKTKEEQADFERDKKRLATLKTLISERESLEKASSDTYLKSLDTKLEAEKKNYQASMVLINAKAKLQTEAEISNMAKNQGGFAISPIQDIMQSASSELVRQEAILADLIQQQKNIKDIKSPANEKLVIQYEGEILAANQDVLMTKDKISIAQSTLNNLLKEQASVEDSLTTANEKQYQLLTQGAQAVATSEALKKRGVTADSAEGKNIIHLQDQKQMLDFIEKATGGIDGISQSMGTMFTQMITQGKSATQALGDMFKSMLDKMISAAMDFIAQGIVKQLFSGFSGEGFSMGGGLTALAGAVAIGTYMGLQQSAKLNTSQTSMNSKYENGLPGDVTTMQNVDLNVANMSFIAYSQEATRFNKDLRDSLGKGFSLMYKQSDAITNFASTALREYFPETMSAISSAYKAFKDSLAPISESLKAGYQGIAKALGLDGLTKAGTTAAAAAVPAGASAAAMANLTQAINSSITPALDVIKTSTAAAGTAATGASLGTNASTNLSNAISNAITPAFQSTKTAAEGAATAAKGMSSSLLSTIGFVASLGIEAYTLATSWDKLDGAMGKAIGVIDAIGNVAFAASIATMGETIASMNPVLLSIAATASVISVAASVIKDGFTPMNISRMVGMAVGAAIGTYILPGIGTLIGIVLGDLVGKLIGSLFEKQKKVDFGVLISKNYTATDEKGQPKYANVKEPVEDKVSKENRVLAMATNMGDVYYGRTQGLAYAITKQEKEFVTRVANTLQSIGDTIGSVDKSLGNTEDFTRNLFRNLGSINRRVEASSFDAMKSTNWLFTTVITNLQKTQSDAGKAIGGWLSVFVKNIPKEYTTSIIMALTEGKELMDATTKTTQKTSILQKLVTEAPIGVLEFIQKRISDMVTSKKTVQQIADETFKIISDSTTGISVVNERFIQLGLVIDNLAKKDVSKISGKLNVQDVSQTAAIIDSMAVKYKLGLTAALQFSVSLFDIINNTFVQLNSDVAKMYLKKQANPDTVIPMATQQYPSDVTGLGATTNAGYWFNKPQSSTVILQKDENKKNIQENPIPRFVENMTKFFETQPKLTEDQLTKLLNTNFLQNSKNVTNSIYNSTKGVGALPSELTNMSFGLVSTKDKSYATNLAAEKSLIQDFISTYKASNSLDTITGKYNPINAVQQEQLTMAKEALATIDAFLKNNALLDKKGIALPEKTGLVQAYNLGAVSIGNVGVEYGKANKGTGFKSEGNVDFTDTLETLSAVADKYAADTKKALDTAKMNLALAKTTADRTSAQKEVDKAQAAYDSDKALKLQQATQEISNNMGFVFESFINAGKKITDVFKGSEFPKQAQEFVDALGGIDKAMSAMDKAKKYAYTESEYSAYKVAVAQNKVDSILATISKNTQGTIKTLAEATAAFKNNPIDASLVNLMGAAADLQDAMNGATKATDTLTKAAEDFKLSIKDWVANAKSSMIGNSRTQMLEASKVFDALVLRIKTPVSGEDKQLAASKITGAADAYANAIKAYYGTSKTGVDKLNDLVDIMDTMPKTVTVAELQLGELQKIKDGILKLTPFGGMSDESKSVIEKLEKSIADMIAIDKTKPTADNTALLNADVNVMLTLTKMADGASEADKSFLNKIIESVGSENGLLSTIETIVNAKLGTTLSGGLQDALNTGFAALLIEVNDVKLNHTAEAEAKLQADIDKYNTLTADIKAAVSALALDPKNPKLIQDVQDAIDAMNTFTATLANITVTGDALTKLYDELKAYFKANVIDIFPGINTTAQANMLSNLKKAFESLSVTVNTFILDNEQLGKAKTLLETGFSAITATINSTADNKTKAATLSTLQDTFANVEALVKSKVDIATQGIAYDTLTKGFKTIDANIVSKLEPTQLALVQQTLKDSFASVNNLVYMDIDKKSKDATLEEIGKAYGSLQATVTVASKLGDAGKGAIDSLTAAMATVTATINNVKLNPTADNLKALDASIADYGPLHAAVSAAITALDTNLDATKTAKLKTDLQNAITALGAFTSLTNLKLAQSQDAFLKELSDYFGLASNRLTVFANVDTTAAIKTLNDLKSSYSTLTQTVNVIPAGDLATAAKTFVDTAFKGITGVVNAANISDTAKQSIFNSLDTSFKTYTALIANASVSDAAKLQASNSMTSAVSAITATIAKTNLAPDIQTTTTAALNTALASMQVLIKDVMLNPTATNQNTLLTQLKSMNVAIDNVSASVTKLDTGSAANKVALASQLQTDVNALNSISAKVGLGLKDTAKTELDSAVSKITPSNVSLTIKFTSWDAISKTIVDNMVTIKDMGDKGIVFNVSLPDIGLGPIQNLMTEVVKTTTEVIKMISGFDSMLTKATEVQKAISLFATGNKIIEAYTPLKGEVRNKDGYININSIAKSELGNYLDSITSSSNINKWKHTGQYDVKSEAQALTYGQNMYDAFNDPQSPYNRYVSQLMGYNETHAEKPIELDLGLADPSMLNEGSYDLGAKVTGYKTTGTPKQVEAARLASIDADYKAALAIYTKAKTEAKKQAQNYYTLMGFNASSAAPYKFAEGGAFTNGIVNTPTAFNMGLMGEAGPEAIMPLVQTSGGLGVRAVAANDSNKDSEVELAEMRKQNQILMAQNTILQEGFKQLINVNNKQAESLDNIESTNRRAAA